MAETGADKFFKWTTWAGTVLVPIILFWYGQSIEKQIETQREAQERQQKAAEDLARSISLLANVSPMLFSNNPTSVAFALQVMAPGDIAIPPPIHPLLLEVVIVYQQKNPEISDLARTLIASKLSPDEIRAAESEIPSVFKTVTGGRAPVPVVSAPPLPALPAPLPQVSAAPAVPAPPPAAPTNNAAGGVDDLTNTTNAILDSKYAVVVESARDEAEAAAHAKQAVARFQAANVDLAVCWAQPVAPSKYFGVFAHTGASTASSLADAQTIRRKAQQAGYPNSYLRVIKGVPSGCTPAS
jgi:hypothetical protein